MNLYETTETLSGPILQVHQWVQEAQDSSVALPHAMNVASLDKDGRPSSRMVLLKRISQEGFVFFTDYEGNKGKQISSLSDLKLGKNKDKSLHGKDYYYKKICSQPFSRLTVLFNGDVTPCCVDWSHKLVVGNVKNESLDKLWNKQANSLRKDHIEGNIEKESPCFNCNYALGHGELEDIDSIKDRLRELYP